MITLRGGTLVTRTTAEEKTLKISKDGDDLDVSGKILLPGLIDCHVHFREPGYEHKATIETEAASAFAGGVTTVCEMPNTNPPTTTIAALADKVRRASAIEGVDIRFYFGVTKEEHLRTLIEMWSSGVEELQRLKKHCCGVKAYLDHSTGNQKIEKNLLAELFKACGEYDVPVVAHCEDPAVNAASYAALQSQDVSAHSDARPPLSEATAVKKAIALAKKYGTKLHVAHLSTKDGLELVRAAKKKGLPITCEVAPHHLFLTTADYASLGTLIKMNPPIRTAEHRDALWEGVIDGSVDCIATDHAPHTLEEKRTGAALSAPSGVPGVETTLPLLLSVAQGHWPHPESDAPACLAINQEEKTSTFTLSHLVCACFDRPNEIFRLGKKRPEEGGDVVVADPSQVWTLHGKDLKSKCGWTPYEGWRVHGKMERIFR